MGTPIFSWLDRRSSGIFCHLSSLPSATGIGTLGSADSFLDFLAEASCKQWQLCPLGPTGFGDSPYQAFSAFAGNPYFIDWNPLIEAGLVDSAALAPLHALPHDRVAYGELYDAFWPIAFAAAEAFFARSDKAIPGAKPFAQFKKKEASWLEPYSQFMGLKLHFKGAPWYEWPAAYRSFAKATAKGLPEAARQTAEVYAFFQYVFYHQIAGLRERAAARGIEIIGDIPIFVSPDSADVWAHPELFKLGKDHRPTHVAGVPPDYFAVDGQLWGNPLYDWSAHASENYAWWIERFRANLRLCDIVRIDHFRGFDSYWSIPAGSPNARGGEWLPGPGLGFFKAIQKTLPEMRLIAEDLGDITDSVRTLLATTGLPGMAVLQFAFSPGFDSSFLPHNHIQNSVVYTGTHDNDSTLGWYANAPEEERDYVRRYLSVSGDAIGWDFIRAAYRSPARIAITPLQDIMSLGSESRLNTPGTAMGNWSWRFSEEQLFTVRNESTAYLRELTELYHR